MPEVTKTDVKVEVFIPKEEREILTWEEIKKKQEKMIIKRIGEE